MIVGIVEQDVEHHAAKELARVLRVYISFGNSLAPQQLRQLGIAESLGGGAQRDACGKAMYPQPAIAIEALDRHSVAVREAHGHRRGHPNFRFLGERHRGVLDQRRVRRVTVGKFDDPLLPGDAQ